MPEPPAPCLRGHDIVCVGFADWDAELWTNQQHLMSRLARENRVLFVESLGLRQPQLAGKDLKRILRRLRRGLAPPRETDGLHVLAPLVIPLHRFALVRALNRRLLPFLVRRAARRLGFERPILWGYVPQAEALLHVLDPSLVVYHCVDDIAAQPGIDGASFRAAEERFARRADLVLASAPSLAARMRTLNDDVLDAPNVADTALFARALQPGPLDAALDALPRPRIVFTGAVVATKLDVPLLVELARARPDWSFALVGPVGPGDPRTDVSALAAEPNVHLLGARAYDELPDVLRGADAGLIPYARNELTDAIFPMKVYEYLAAGLPVVATELPSIAGVQEVATAPDAAGLAALLGDALAHDDPARRFARSRAAEAHSWDARLAQIARAVAALDAVAHRAAAGRREPRDVLVSVHTPVLRSGRAMRTYGVARALAAAGGGLTFVYVRFGGEQPDATHRAIPGIAFEPVEPSRGLRRALAYGAARLRGVPDDFARGVAPELAAAVRRLAADSAVRVIADGPTEAAALAGLARRRPLIYNAHNLESAYRHELATSAGLGSPRRLRRFERGVLARAAEAWMVSEADAAAARELRPGVRVRLVPNVVDVAAIAPVEPDVAARRALFVGDFTYEPNRTALRFLLDEAMPRVWRELPDARLRLVGRGLDAPPSDDPRVEPLGFVERLADAYAGVSAAAVPLLQGGGTPLKLVEALAYGLPVVATPRAAAGLAVRDGEHCLLADGVEAYAEALTQVLRDGAPELGRRGRALAAERYSIEALTRLVAR